MAAVMMTTVRATTALLVVFISLMVVSRAVAAILPYGGEIAFRDAVDGENVHIHLADVHRGTMVNLTDGLVDNASQPAWSPDGRWLAFTSVPCDSCGNFIYVMDVTTHQTRQLTHEMGSVNQDLMWSPDGTRLALTGALDRTREDRGGVYILDMDDGTFRRISGDTHNQLWPIWSPNSRQIAFVATTSMQPFSLFVMDANCEGCNARVLPEVGDMYSWLDWSPDGHQIVISDNQGNIHIAAVSFESLTDELILANGSVPVWSPQGDRIAYVSAGAGLWNSGEVGTVYAVNPDGSDDRPLGDFTLDWMVALTWSPDGRQLAFVSYCDVDYLCIYVMDATSGHVWRAVRFKQWCRPQDCRIAWRPMGES